MSNRNLPFTKLGEALEAAGIEYTLSARHHGYDIVKMLTIECDPQEVSGQSGLVVNFWFNEDGTKCFLVEHRKEQDENL